MPGGFQLILGLTVAAVALVNPRDMNQGRASADHLHSPWDLVQKPSVHASYKCPTTIYVTSSPRLEGFYSDPSYSVIDPVKYGTYEKASSPIFQLVNNIAQAADAYRSSGSEEAAQCAVTQLREAAHDRALAGNMQSKQANYVQGWAAGAFAIDYLKIRPSQALSSVDRLLILGWLRGIGHQTLAYYAQQRKVGGTDATNNHVYWAAMEIAAIAIADDDGSLWNWSLSVFEEGVNDIASDGTLPLELLRKQRALHYHLFAASPLVMLAEMGCANGLDLYSEHANALPKLANRSLYGLIDNSYFTLHAGIAQDSPKGLPTAEEIGWADPYLKRFPNRRFSKLLRSAPSVSYQFTGGLPPPASGPCGAVTAHFP